MLYKSYGGRQRYSKDWKDMTHDIPINTPLYGFAYFFADSICTPSLKCPPVLGEVISLARFRELFPKLKHKYSHLDGWGRDVSNSPAVFIPYKRNTKEFSKSGYVEYTNRIFADTYEEAVEYYNSRVKSRINALIECSEQAKEDYISINYES